MSHLDLIRAWKDEEYRLSLSEAERALLPSNPAGLIELPDTELGAVAGGLAPYEVTWPTCCFDRASGFKCA
jgi:mersacidin/lichenicidin family type 2 lantibiotic